MQSTIETIALDAIDESPLNPRKTYGDLSELRESIKTAGIIHKPIVRPMMDDRFELVVGHRRRRALLELGETSTECEVRVLDDKECLELMLIENSTREDVAPLEEAAAYAQLHAPPHSLPVEELAVRTGKTAKHVYGRMRLQVLCDEAKDALAKGDLLLGAAVVLTRLESADDQRKALKEVAGDDYRGPANAAEARDVVDALMRKLKDAPFDLGAAGLVPDAGACASCPKRTGASPDLFDDVKDDRCTDGACWSSKVRAHGEQRLLEAKEKGLPILGKSDTKDVFKHGNRPSYEWVDVDDKCWEADGKKWKTLLKGSSLQPAVALDPEGVPRHVVRRDDAMKQLRELGILHPLRLVTGAGATLALHEAVQRASIRLIIDAAADEWMKGETAPIVALLAEFVVWHSHHEDAKAVCQRRGLDVKGQEVRKVLEEHLFDLEDEHDRAALMLEVLIGAGSTASVRCAAVAKDLGVDLSSVRQEVKAELAEKKKAKAPKAKKATKKASKKKKAKAPKAKKATKKASKKKKAKKSGRAV